MTKVAVVIPNWNGAEVLNGCLAALGEQSLVPDRVVVVDNGSEDDSLAVCASYPWVEVVALPTNTGFAWAVNEGLRSVSEVDLVAVLNNDTQVMPGWLENAIRPLADEPTCAAVSSRMVSASDPRVLDSAGIAFSWRRGGRDLGRGSSDPFWARSRQEIFAACAGAAVYRVAALQQVGGFADDFFAYFEDVDLGFRLRAAGWIALYEPTAVVVHLGGATLGHFSVRHLRLWTANEIRVLVRNVPARILWRHAGALTVHMGAHAVRCAKHRAIGAFVGGIGDVVRANRSLRRQRAEIAASGRWSPAELEAAVRRFDQVDVS